MDVFGWIVLGLAGWLAVSVAAGLLLGALLRRRWLGFAPTAAEPPPAAEQPLPRRRAA